MNELVFDAVQRTARTAYEGRHWSHPRGVAAQSGGGLVYDGAYYHVKIPQFSRPGAGPVRRFRSPLPPSIAA